MRLGVHSSVLQTVAVVFGLLALAGPALSRERVAVELVLAVDTSVSVSEAEYRLQMSGIARALRSPEIADVIANQPGGVAVTLMHWSIGSLNHQAVAWQRLSDYPSVLEFAGLVEQTPRIRTGRGTSIGDAIDYAAHLIDSNDFDGVARKIDISGDSRSNSGPSPHFARDRAVSRGITVNGLVIPDGDRELVSYFRILVIGGEDSFVLTASRNADFAKAMKRKLARELNLFAALRDPSPG